MEITVVSGETVYRFNKRLSAFDSIKHKGKELLDKPMQFNFFRAPIDNDVMKNDWYRAHLDDHTVKSYETTLLITEDHAEINVRQSFGWSIHQPFVQMNVTYIIGSCLDICCHAEFSNKVELLPRFGIRLFMPERFRTVDYFGYGPYESYIDKHHSCYMGHFTSDICDMHEDYIMPQENSSHYNCRYVSVSDGNTSVRFTSDGDFSFNASEYTQEELAAKRHNYELEKCGSSVICVDHRMAGVGSNACGPVLAERYRLPLPELTAAFRMEIL